LLAYCLGKCEGGWPCYYRGTLAVDRFEPDEVLEDIERRCRCSLRMATGRSATRLQQAAGGTAERMTSQIQIIESHTKTELASMDGAHTSF